MAGVKTESLIYHGGVIEEAINIEFPGEGGYDEIGIFPSMLYNLHTTYFSSFCLNLLLLKQVGLNGQQPNADIVMTVAACAESLGVRVTLHDQSEVTRKDDIDSHFAMLQNILDYMKIQALGMPLSHHAFYTRYEFWCCCFQC